MLVPFGQPENDCLFLTVLWFPPEISVGYDHKKVDEMVLALLDLTMFSTDVQAGGPSSVFSRERPDLFRCYPGRIFRQIDNIDAIDHTHGPDRADSPTQQFGYRLSKPYRTALGILPHRRHDVIFKINCRPHE